MSSYTSHRRLEAAELTVSPAPTVRVGVRVGVRARVRVRLSVRITVRNGVRDRVRVGLG